MTSRQPTDATGSASDARLTWLRRATGCFGIFLILATWKLWTPQEVFPQIPLVYFARNVPFWLDWSALGVVGLALAGLIVPWRRVVNSASILCAVGFLVLFAVNQHRLQPWAYQIVIFCVVFATQRGRLALRCLRVVAISIYVYSAFGKFDQQFLHTLGQQFLSQVLDFVHIPHEHWRPNHRLGLAVLFPATELLVAVGLCWGKTRRLSVIFAIVMHSVLILVLGPWGLNHQFAVLLWNGFFAVYVPVLFWPARRESPEDMREKMWRVDVSAVGTLITGVAVVLPLLEPLGYCDHWLAWGLYSPRNSRVVCLIDSDAVDQLPAPLQRYLRVSQDDIAVLQLRLDLWSLDQLGVPVYPQDRFQHGVVLAVSESYELGDAVAMYRQGISNRWTGQRTRETFDGQQAIAEAASTYRINARPR